MPTPLRGRQAEAARNDTAILDAARQVFISDPDAPIAAVAKRAGVGIGAVYHRYESKEHLLATLCLNGEDVYIAEAEHALSAAGDPWEVYTEFLRRIVAANTHALVVRLAGRFTPTAEHNERAERMIALGTELFDRTKAAGVLRDDLTFLDVAFLLEMLSASPVADPARSGEIRQRQLAVVVDGLRSRPDLAALPGTPPTWEEQYGRW